MVERFRDRETQRETERHRERQRDTETQRETERDRERQTDLQATGQSAETWAPILASVPAPYDIYVTCYA